MVPPPSPAFPHPYTRGGRRLFIDDSTNPHCVVGEGLDILDDGPKVDAWLELMEQRGAFDELVTFFYDSFSLMAGHAGSSSTISSGCTTPAR